MDNTKVCCDCLKELPATKFHRNGRKCNTCRHALDKKETDSRVWLLKWARSRAKIKGLEINITREDITIPAMCPLLDIPLKTNIGAQRPNSPSLDRVDATKGYIKGNVRVISLAANTMKGSMTLAQIKLFTERITAYVTSVQ